MTVETIKIGDLFDWQPYGTSGWPRSSSYGIKVVRITQPDPNSEDGWDYLDTTDDLCVDADLSEVLIYTEDRKGRVHCNDLPHFLEMTRRVTYDDNDERTN